jgi:hypothetical protein
VCSSSPSVGVALHVWTVASLVPSWDKKRIGKIEIDRARVIELLWMFLKLKDFFNLFYLHGYPRSRATKMNYATHTIKSMRELSNEAFINFKMKLFTIYSSTLYLVFLSSIRLNNEIRTQLKRLLQLVIFVNMSIMSLKPIMSTKNTWSRMMMSKQCIYVCSNKANVSIE